MKTIILFMFLPSIFLNTKGYQNSFRKCFFSQINKSSLHAEFSKTKPMLTSKTQIPGSTIPELLSIFRKDYLIIASSAIS